MDNNAYWKVQYKLNESDWQAYTSIRDEEFAWTHTNSRLTSTNLKLPFKFDFERMSTILVTVYNEGKVVARRLLH